MRILYTVYRIQYTVQYTEQIVSVVDWHVWKNVGLYGDHERPLQSWISEMCIRDSRGSAHRFVEHMTLGAVWCTQGRPVRPPLDDLFVFTIHLHLTTQILCMRDSIHSGGLDGNSSWSTPPCIAVSSFGLACASSLARQQLN